MLSPQQRNAPCSFVINTDNTGLPGEHWVCVYESSDTNMTQNIFFDSYGNKPSKLNPLWKPYDLYQYSLIDYQQTDSTVCGDYCLYVLKMLNMGRTLNNVLDRFDVYDKKKNNDEKVAKRIHNKYPRILNRTPHAHIINNYTNKNAVYCQGCISRQQRFNKRACFVYNRIILRQHVYQPTPPILSPSIHLYLRTKLFG